MEEFIAVNDGFRRRVGHTIHMFNYTGDDLATMTRRQLFQRFKFPIDTDLTYLSTAVSVMIYKNLYQCWPCQQIRPGDEKFNE